MDIVKTTAGLLAAMLLQGCTTVVVIPEEQAFRPALQVTEMRVAWIVSDDPTTQCKRLAPKALGAHPQIPACAAWSRAAGTCTVVTSTTTSHQVLGHEVRHCFKGHFHPPLVHTATERTEP
jgi:hypothetical protein